MNSISQSGLSAFPSNRFGGAQMNAFHNGGHHHHHGRDIKAVETNLAVSREVSRTTETDGAASRQLDVSQSSVSMAQTFENRRDLIQSAKHIMRSAVRSLASDFSQAFEAMGIGRDGLKEMVKGFMKPMMQALRSGADFSGQLQMAVLDRSSLSTASGISESLSVVARSIDISVNHTTGEFKINVERVEIEQETNIPSFATASLPGAGYGLTPPPAETAMPVADLADVLEPADTNETSGGTDEATPEVDLPLEIALPNADASDEMSESRFENTRSSLTINAMHSYQNAEGERITQLFVDARISLSRVLESQSEEASTFNSMRMESNIRLDIRA